jgi:hypothetical protein
LRRDAKNDNEKMMNIADGPQLRYSAKIVALKKINIIQLR